MTPRSDPAQVLRGGLDGSTGMRAREIAVWVDTTCQRARALGTVGVSGRGAHSAVYGQSEQPGTSPFASEAGSRHEFMVARDGETGKAELLRQLYAGHGIVVDAGKVIDFDAAADAPAGNAPDDVRREFDRLAAERTAAVLADPGTEPLMLLQARVQFRLAGVQHTVKPDVLVWTGARWRLGEMKAYLDRGGYTDGTSIAKAVKQCAVGAIAVGQQVGDGLVDPVVDLVLRAEGKVPATLRSLPAEAEIASIRWADAHSVEDAEMFLAMTGGRPLDSDEALRMIPHEYSTGCHGSCDLAEKCKAEAEQRRAERLGAGAFSHLGVSNARAVELAGGASPSSPSEAALASVLRDGWSAAAV